MDSDDPDLCFDPLAYAVLSKDLGTIKHLVEEKNHDVNSILEGPPDVGFLGTGFADFNMMMLAMMVCRQKADFPILQYLMEHGANLKYRSSDSSQLDALGAGLDHSNYAAGRWWLDNVKDFDVNGIGSLKMGIRYLQLSALDHTGTFVIIQHFASYVLSWTHDFLLVCHTYKQFHASKNVKTIFVCIL